MASGCAYCEIVLAQAFVAASYADTLQVSHCGNVVRCKLLRIDAKRTKKFWELIGGVRAFICNKLQFLAAQPNIARYGGDLFRSTICKFVLHSDGLTVFFDPIGDRIKNRLNAAMFVSMIVP